MDWISREQWVALEAEGTDVYRVVSDRGGWVDRYGGWVVWQEYKTMDEDGNGLSVVKTDPNFVGGASASLRF